MQRKLERFIEQIKVFGQKCKKYTIAALMTEQKSETSA
jgi:hypothetical protein